MFEKDLNIGVLLDFYGDVLSAHTRTLMEQYYNEDLSLAEIADGAGISRQGVRQAIKKGEEEMAFLESRLGMAALAKNAEAVLALAQADSTPLAEAARRLALQILNRKEVDGCSET